MNKKIPQIRQIEMKRQDITTWDFTLPQLKKVENHLLTHGKITTWKAWAAYGITRLAVYINTLRNRDWKIDSPWKYKKDSRGKIIKKWVEYQLKNYPNS